MASVLGLPNESWRPSGKLISDALARVSPSREAKPLTLMLVPAGSELRFHPRRRSALGAPPSTRQVWCAPVCRLTTSTWIHECGLTHSNFTTLPESVIGFVESNSCENEWCA